MIRGFIKPELHKNIIEQFDCVKLALNFLYSSEFDASITCTYLVTWLCVFYFILINIKLISPSLLKFYRIAFGKFWIYIRTSYNVQYACLGLLSFLHDSLFRFIMGSTVTNLRHMLEFLSLRRSLVWLHEVLFLVQRLSNRNVKWSN